MANIRGFGTLLRREIQKFIKSTMQTIVAPVISSLLYIIVFGKFIGSQIPEVNGHSYMEFLIPGLIMMSVITNSYFNSSLSILIGKFFNNLTEVLTTPLSYFEMVLAFTLGGVMRGFVVGIFTLLVSFLFIPIRMFDVFVFAYFIFFVSVIFSSVGVMMGLWAATFDHLETFSSFVLTPLTFLGGVFYSINMLPELLKTLSRFNPLLFMINGMRYGVLGISDVDILLSMVLVFILGALLFGVNVWLFKRGYKIKT